jgi:hypothetical protein
LRNGIPHHEVYRRVISRIAPEEIERRFMDWVRAIKTKRRTTALTITI